MANMHFLNVPMVILSHLEPKSAIMIRIMSDKVKTKLPDVELATKDWVIKEMIDTEKRIEKAFGDQTRYIGEKTSALEKAFGEQTRYIGEKTGAIEKAFHDQTQYLSRKHDDLMRWMFGLTITMTVAILVAVLFGG